MISAYQPDSVAKYFDELGIGEWERLVRTPADEVSLFLHSHYLTKYLKPGHRILEIGAGVGRFTQIIAELGVQIVVADLSRVQLELNQAYSKEHGFEDEVVDWQQVDICDLSGFESRSFDAVVAYGGPFSYVLDKRDKALSECMRVLKPGGTILLSVMSLWGTVHSALAGVLSISPETNQKIIASGNITPDTFPERSGNYMHLFKSNDLLDWLEGAGLMILDASASNCLSLTWNEKLKEIRADVERWNELLKMELEACASGGCLNMGTHIIVIVQKTDRK